MPSNTGPQITMRRPPCRERRSATLIRVAVFLLILLFFAFLIDRQIRPVIKATCAFRLNAIGVTLSNDAAYQQLNDNPRLYQEMVKINYNAGGYVSSVETDASYLNRVKGEIVDGVMRRLADLKTQKIPLSLWTMLGARFLAEWPPFLHMRVNPYGYVNAKVTSVFDSAGVNQTRHRLVLDLSMDMNAYIPGYGTDVTVKNQIILAETIIVGEVPEYYTQILSDEQFSLPEYLAETHTPS